MSSERRDGGWTPTILAALLVCAGLVGCGQPKGAIFGDVDPGLRWPPPPEPARIRFVGTIETTEDLRAGRSVFDGLGAALFGREDARSMLTPYAICSDGDRVFVCDSNAQTVHVFDLGRRRYDRWEPPDGFAQPVGIAFDPGGRVLVADSVASAIHAFETDGDYLGELGGEHLLRPCGLAVDHARGRLFVADAAAHQVVVLALDGRLLARVGARGTEAGAFNYPTNVAVDASGRLFVADSLNFRVQEFDADLRPVRVIGSQGDLPGYFSQPKGLAVDGAGRLYVVDAHFESVQMFDRDGRLLLAFGQEGHGPGEFWLPAGIHVDAQERIWVADTYNRRLQVFACEPETAP